MKNELYIFIDDSGKLNKNENSCIFGGLFFYSSYDYMNFINKYKHIINEIKCKYCHYDPRDCLKNCIEIKGITKISTSDKRRIFNLLKKQYNFGIFIKNNKIYNFIINDKASRGRYLDYAQKRIIKEIIIYSIKMEKINPNSNLKIYIKSDEAKTKSNGYYNLKNSIYEELVNGIINYDYSKIYKPLIKGKLFLNYKFYNSKTNYGIQSADMISHYLHQEYQQALLKNKNITKTINNINVTLFLP